MKSEHGIILSYLSMIIVCLRKETKESALKVLKLSEKFSMAK